MDKMTRQRKPVKQQTAASWPAWTDFVRYYPTDAEQAENAAMNATWDDSDGPAPTDPIWDEMAQEAIALDQLTRGVRMF